MVVGWGSDRSREARVGKRNWRTPNTERTIRLTKMARTRILVGVQMG
jgi:hypothetical protein